MVALSTFAEVGPTRIQSIPDISPSNEGSCPSKRAVGLPGIAEMYRDSANRCSVKRKVRPAHASID
jgi:hypothetical protein